MAEFGPVRDRRLAVRLEGWNSRSTSVTLVRVTEEPALFTVKVSAGGVLLGEYSFNEDVVTIGRDPNSGLHVDNAVVVDIRRWTWGPELIAIINEAWVAVDVEWDGLLRIPGIGVANKSADRAGCSLCAERRLGHCRHVAKRVQPPCVGVRPTIGIAGPIGQ